MDEAKVVDEAQLAEENSGNEDWKQQAAQAAADCLGVDYYSCEEAVKRLNEYLDHQLTDAERIVVMRHLEICRPCLRRFTFEQTLIISLRQKVSHLCTPLTLREKLHKMLRDKGE